jgi:hypothetical protein
MRGSQERELADVLVEGAVEEEDSISVEVKKLKFEFSNSLKFHFVSFSFCSIDNFPLR